TPIKRLITTMDSRSANEERRRMEHESVVRQRRLAPETEDDLLAMQEEFLKANDRPAAAVVRVKPPTLISSSISSTKSTVKDEEGDDMPPLEKDVVSLNSDDLSLNPPTVSPSSSKLRAGSRFLQDRANKGPRTHFQTPAGERFEINFDDTDENHSTSSRPVRDD
ncbi:hypothetical protein BGX27_006746, partial [Mortierella sp. AM989]